MRSLAALALLVAVVCVRASVPAAQTPEPLSRFLDDLRVSARAGEMARFLETSVPDLPAPDADRLRRLVGDLAPKSFAIGERARAGQSLLADVLVETADGGRLSSWQLDFSSAVGTARPSLLAAAELGSFENLLRLELNRSRQYAVHDLKITAPDLALRLRSGSVFLVGPDHGVSGLVFRGEAFLEFSPPDRAEQGQLRIFCGSPSLSTVVDELYIRANPADFDSWIDRRNLRPARLDAGAYEDALETFERYSARSYQIDLRHLTADRWSVTPVFGGLLVDFRAGRLGQLTYTFTPADPEDVTLFDRERRLQISTYRSTTGIHVWMASPYDVQQTTLDLTFDPARRWISARASLRLSLSPQASSVSFKLADAFVISSVTSPELGSLLPLRIPGQNSIVLALPADRDLTRETIGIDVQYHGRLDPQTLAGDVVSPGGLRAGSQESASEVEPRFLYTVSSGWYPQVDAAGHAPASIRVTVPATYRVVATGVLRREVESDAADVDGATRRRVRTFEFLAEQPVPYLSFLVSRLVDGGRTVAVVPALSLPEDTNVAATIAHAQAVVAVDVWATPQRSGRRRPMPASIAAMIEFFASRVGEAPYPSFTLASLEDVQPSAHSPAYFALINTPVAGTPLSWRDDPVAFDDVPEFLVAHEVAHQWWGQSVSPRDYHAQWISEGFAQYFAWLYIEATAGPASSRSVMARMRGSADERSSAGPIHLGYRLGHLERQPRDFRAIVYNKSAVVLHMLRRIVGDDAFFAGVRRFYVAHRFQTATYRDVLNAFQAETRLPLERFFEGWIRDGRVPEVRLDWRQSAGGRVAISLKQGADPFDIPLDLSLRYADGRRSRVAVVARDASTEVTVQADGVLREIVIDDETSLVRAVR